ncbi:MAG TPA: hypothetical protein VGB85_18050, partial [Nannocystis sp.]
MRTMRGRPDMFAGPQLGIDRGGAGPPDMFAAPRSSATAHGSVGPPDMFAGSAARPSCVRASGRRTCSPPR